MLYKYTIVFRVGPEKGAVIQGMRKAVSAFGSESSISIKAFGLVARSSLVGVWRAPAPTEQGLAKHGNYPTATVTFITTGAVLGL